MHIPTESYESILDQYDVSLDWLTGIGISPNKGRTQFYRRVISNWSAAYTKASQEEGKQVFPNFVSSMHEVQDIIAIYQKFKNTPIEELGRIIAKLKFAINGPEHAADENINSTQARNLLFEAAVAAKLHIPEKGINCIFNAKSDTGVKLGKYKLWIECKRLTSTGGIEDNVRKACNQLERQMNSRYEVRNRGIVALEVSKILQPGDKIFVSPNDRELQVSISNIMDSFINNLGHNWHNVYAIKNRRIIGTIIKFSFMATSEERNLIVHSAQWAINPTVHASPREHILLRELVDLVK